MAAAGDLGWTIRRSAYFDSVALMRVAEQARQIPGVIEVALVMGTPANRATLMASELWPADAPATAPEDLLIAVRAKSDDALRLALASVEQRLDAPRESSPAARDDVAPRTIVGARRRAGVANLALIAVPGPYAAIDAHQALSAGLHVFLFSDGVSLADEVALKGRGRELGLIVMGPECGTSIVNGVGLGFANRVRRGSIGVVGASGTGIQEVTTLVHRLGGGVSHAIGTGGRDLDAAVARRRRPRACRRGPNGETRRRVPPRLRRTDPKGPRGRDDAGGGGHHGCSTHRRRPARPGPPGHHLLRHGRQHHRPLYRRHPVRRSPSPG